MISIRKFRVDDVDECIQLFRDTVRTVNAKDYTSKQLNAWAPDTIDKSDWQKRLSENITYVAEINNQIVGFGNMTQHGYVDLLYVHKYFQRRGVAKSIIRELESIAIELHIKEFSTEASITAKPFFERMGYKVLEKQFKEYRGEKFINFVMKKIM